MDGKVLAHLVLQSKVLAKPLTDLSAWVGFCTSSPHQGVKYQQVQVDQIIQYICLVSGPSRPNYTSIYLPCEWPKSTKLDYLSVL